jgi:NTP pyrophosphatase (non-canonical NTP hydrolase)
MHFSDYQRDARRTDQLSASTDEFQRVLTPLLGLAGEAGQLVSEFKNYLVRHDDQSYFAAIVQEELGDVLWYLANLADRFGVKLDDIAFANLVKIQNRWPSGEDKPESSPNRLLFDSAYGDGEQLPRNVTLFFEDAEVQGRGVVRTSFVGPGGAAGDKLTDNAYIDDGYRFHDAFHLSYATCLGWSPVLRGLWKRKRKSNQRVDEVEDGGRAAVIEEGIAALVFSDAKEKGLYVGSQKIDSSILRVIKNMTAHLEVSICSYRDWQTAILLGYSVFRELQRHGGGYVTMNINEASLEYKASL